MNQQQREQAAAGATPVPANITPVTKQQQANSAPAPSLVNPNANRSNVQPQPQQRQPAQSLQLHNLRPSSNQLPNLTGKQAVKLSSNAAESNTTATEQSALDMAQSAAARVTGSAVAAIAATKFKMLRSNTLAAAFGRPANDSDQANTENSNVAQHDLLAVRTKDERIVNTLSTTSSSMMTRNRLNLDAN